MSDALRLDELDSAEFSEVESIADRFEEIWRPGATVAQMRPFVSQAREPLRFALLEELIRIDRAKRERAGMDVTFAQYVSEFPEFQD